MGGTYLPPCQTLGAEPVGLFAFCVVIDSAAAYVAAPAGDSLVSSSYSLEGTSGRGAHMFAQLSPFLKGLRLATGKARAVPV